LKVELNCLFDPGVGHPSAVAGFGDAQASRIKTPDHFVDDPPFAPSWIPFAASERFNRPAHCFAGHFSIF
jgi:hypothetical protein